MILGTAQLGLTYGISNSAGKPSSDDAHALLDFAYYHGISMLDTAQAYGDSEKIIGDYQSVTGNLFRICTKLPVEMSEITVHQALQKSMDHLKVSAIDVCYLHRFEQCYNEEFMANLMEEKNLGKVKQIGISIYEPKELIYILEHMEGVVDVIQFPYNLFAKDMWNEDLLRDAHESFTLYARSIYLQGLILMNSNHSKVKELEADQALIQLGELAVKWDTDVKSLAWSFVQNHPYIDDFLVGCETLEQLEENICLNPKEDYYRRLQSIEFNINEAMLDPRRW